MHKEMFTFVRTFSLMVEVVMDGWGHIMCPSLREWWWVSTVLTLLAGHRFFSDRASTVVVRKAIS